MRTSPSAPVKTRALAPRRLGASLSSHRAPCGGGGSTAGQGSSYLAPHLYMQQLHPV